MNIEVQVVKYFDSKTIIEQKLWARNSASLGAYKDKQNIPHKFDILVDHKGKFDLIIVVIEVVI